MFGRKCQHGPLSDHLFAFFKGSLFLFRPLDLLVFEQCVQWCHRFCCVPDETMVVVYHPEELAQQLIRRRFRKIDDPLHSACQRLDASWIYFVSEEVDGAGGEDALGRVDSEAMHLEALEEDSQELFVFLFGF